MVSGKKIGKLLGRIASGARGGGGGKAGGRRRGRGRRRKLSSRTIGNLMLLKQVIGHGPAFQAAAMKATESVRI